MAAEHPAAICSRCGRESAVAAPGDVCGARTAKGNPCHGTFAEIPGHTSSGERPAAVPGPDASPQPPPMLGPAISRNCTRWLGDHNCGKPAVRHVIWDATMENSFVCVEHLAELGVRWSFLVAHEVGPDCGMPGSLFFEEENVCRCPDDLVAAPEEVEYATA